MDNAGEAGPEDSPKPGRSRGHFRHPGLQESELGPSLGPPSPALGSALQGDTVRSLYCRGVAPSTASLDRAGPEAGSWDTERELIQ